MTDLIDLRTLKRPSSPNTAFYVPGDIVVASETDAVTPVFPIDAKTLADRACALWSAQKRVTLEARSDDGLKAHFVAVTALMRFRDDIYVEFVELGDGQSGFLIYSASRVGYGDLGTNRKRVEQWISELQKAVKGA